MKKAIAILLALVLGISMLAACSGDTPEPETEQPAGTPAPTPTPTPTPPPEPELDGMNTVEITNDDYGDIIFSYPDDGSVEVTIAEPGAEDKSLIPRDEFEALLGMIIQSHYNIEFQKALITGEDFYLMVGYTNYFDSGSGYKSFGMVEHAAMRVRGEPLTLDGLNGFVQTSHVASIIFPALTQNAGRVILVFPNSVDEGDDVREMSRDLFQREDIQAILNTFRFPGEILNEPRLETQPIDNNFFSLTLTDGWEVKSMNFMWHIYELEKGEIRIEIRPSDSRPVSYRIDEFLSGNNVYRDMEQIDNATFNGQEFVVLHDEGWKKFVLITSRGGGPLDLESTGYVMLDTSQADSLDELAALLSTIRVK